MRVRITGGVLAIFLLFTIFCGGLTAFAEEKRVYDQAGLFSADDAMLLDARASTLTRELEADLIIVTTDDTRGKTSRDYADDFYDDNGFGVGEDKTGVLFLIDMDNREVYISTSGKAIAYLTDTVIDGLLDDSVDYLKQQDYSGAAWHFLDRMKKRFPSGNDAPVERKSEFVFDQVGLLLPNQALSLESDAATLSKSLRMDLVIVTADDTAGKASQTYADEFFQSNGFGQGDNKSGVLFLIDIANRQVTLSTSGRAARLLTEEWIQSVLDRVAPLMETQDYNGAAKAFLEAMREFVWPETKYVLDLAGMLTKEQLTALDKEAEEASRRWGVDMVMVYTDDLQGEDIQDYTKKLYYERDYRSKAVLMVHNLTSEQVYLQTWGDSIENLQEDMPLLENPMQYLREGDYAGAVKSFLEEAERELHIEEMRQKERERRERQRQREQRLRTLIIIGGILSLIGGFIAVQIARSGYKARVEKEEEQQQRGGLLHLTVDEDILVNTYTTSRYIPPPPPPSSHSGGSSGGGSSGGGSSFGGGSSGFGGSTHTSSGGATHGGGGRGF